MSKGKWSFEKRIRILQDRLSWYAFKNKKRDSDIRDLRDRVHSLELSRAGKV